VASNELKIFASIHSQGVVDRAGCDNNPFTKERYCTILGAMIDGGVLHLDYVAALMDG
jgi:hypothetical protein